MKHACGNTCMMHHVIGCVFTAFGTNRTLVFGNLDENGYDSNEGSRFLSTMFKPWSETCTNYDKTQPVKEWKRKYK